MHELPLVFFTVFAQASAGLLIVMVINQCLCRHDLNDKARFATSILSLVLVGVAGFSALLHLGQPFRAINALFGSGRSPMSNEIVSCGVYGGLLFVSVTVAYLRPAMTPVITIVRLLAAIAGMVLLILIPKVYTLTTIPQWDTPYTSIQMILAALTTGGTLAMIWQPNRFNLLITTIGVISGVAIVPGYMAYLSDTVPQMLQHGMGFWNTKFALYAVALVLAVFSYRKPTKSLAISASVIFLIAELCGRIAFYDLWSISM